MTDVHEFSESSELGALCTQPRFMTHGRGRIRLSGRLATHLNSAEWERLLNRYYFACGCAEGAKGTVIGLLGATLLTLDSMLSGRLDWVSLIICSFGLIIVASIIGKLAGLLRARRRLRDLVIHISGEVPPKPRAPHAKIILCG